MPGDDDIYRAQVTQRTPLNVALCAIWYRLWQLTGFSTTNTPVGIPIIPPAGGMTDGGPGWTTSLGIGGARFTSADQSGAVASITDAPTSGQKIVVTDILFSSDTALRLDFSCETSGVIVASVYCTAGSSGQFTPRGKLKLASADKKLQVRASVAGNIAVTPLYYSEA